MLLRERDLSHQRTTLCLLCALRTLAVVSILAVVLIPLALVLVILLPLLCILLILLVVGLLLLVVGLSSGNRSSGGGRSLAVTWVLAVAAVVVTLVVVALIVSLVVCLWLSLAVTPSGSLVILSLAVLIVAHSRLLVAVVAMLSSCSTITVAPPAVLLVASMVIPSSEVATLTLIASPCPLGTTTVVIALVGCTTTTESSLAVVEAFVWGWAGLAALLVVLLYQRVSLFSFQLDEGHVVKKLTSFWEHKVGYRKQRGWTLSGRV